MRIDHSGLGVQPSCPITVHHHACQRSLDTEGEGDVNARVAVENHFNPYEGIIMVSIALAGPPQLS